MERMLWFTGSTGINNRIDPVRNKYDKEVGVTDAKIAINIDYDYTGRVSRRSGWNYTEMTEDCHSLFCDGGTCLLVKGDALCILGNDYNYKALRNVTVGAKMSYTTVGDKIYYANGREKGVVSAGFSRSWTIPSTIYSKDSTRILSAPPIGSKIEYHNGRMYVIQYSTVWASEYMNLNSFNLTKDYMNFESAIRMFKGVNNGVWLSTDCRLVFLEGSSLSNYKYKRKAMFGVLPGSDILIDGINIGNGDIEGVGVIFASTEGIFFGDENGRLYPLTHKKLNLPNAISCTAVLKGKNYILTLDSSLTVVLNIEMLGVSQYTNFDFSSYTDFNGVCIGANSSGVFELKAQDWDSTDSSTVSNIDAKYEIGPTDFGFLTEKRIRKCAVSYESDGEMKATFKVDEGTNYIVKEEFIPQHTDERQSSVQVPVGRDLKGRYFGITIENTKGSNFSIDLIEAFIDILPRKPSK